MTDIDSLRPTQQLVLDVLAARHRLGEQVWTFPSAVNPALRALEKLGLVTLLSGIVEKSTRARLTDAGRHLVLKVGPPNGGIERLRAALQAILDYAEPRADLIIGLDSVADTARRALESGPQ